MSTTSRKEKRADSDTGRTDAYGNPISLGDYIYFLKAVDHEQPQRMRIGRIVHWPGDPHGPAETWGVRYSTGTCRLSNVKDEEMVAKGWAAKLGIRTPDLRADERGRRRV